MRVWDIWEFETKYATKYGNMVIMGIMGSVGSMGQMDTLGRVCFGTIVVL